MNKEIDILIQLLKNEIQNKFWEVTCAADCRILSEKIKISTKRQVSISTLKRFFGIIKSPFNPSKYTLDSLAIYMGFNDCKEFFNRFENEKSLIVNNEIWNNFKKRTSVITNTSLKSLKDKIGIRLENFPLRKFAENKFDDFLCSSKIATAFIAPDGYGKSTTVTQLTEMFFTSADAKYPNDVICLVDGSILYNLLTYSPDVNRLYNLIEYDPAKSFDVVFRTNPELVKGRFVVIIDGIDDIYSENEKTEHFIDNLLNIILSYENIAWFKLLITCSPNKWRMLTYRMQKKQILKSFWFDVTFQGTDDDIINIPPLKRKEIRTILEKNNFNQTIDDLCFNHPHVLDIIINPYMLHLFLSTHEHSGTIRDIDLLDQYITNAILLPPHSEEKFLIIKSFFTLCRYGKKSTEVGKEELNLSPSMIIAYNELILSSILSEYSISDGYLSLTTFVKFSQNVLFSYYLANILIKENELSIDFLKSVITGYNNSPHLQCNILRYIIKILFKEERVELLKNIFSVIDKDMFPKDIQGFNMPCYVLTNVVGVELRKNQKFREMLIPSYAQSEEGRTFYFERFFDIDSLVLHSGDDLDWYLKYNQTNDAKIYFHYMKFMQHFLSNNHEQCKTEYENCLNLEFPEGRNLLNISFFFIPQLIYQSVFEKEIDKNLLAEVYKMSNRLLQNGIHMRTEPPQLEFAIIFSLNYGRMNKEIIDLAHYIFENYDLTNLKSSSFYQLFLIVYAKALLETGATQIAMELYRQVKFKNINIPEHMKYYVRIRYLLIKTDFLVYEGKLKKARQNLRKIKELSHMLKFSYMYNSALRIEKYIETIPDVV